MGHTSILSQIMYVSSMYIRGSPINFMYLIFMIDVANKLKYIEIFITSRCEII